jgi:hypothetical protein
MKTFILATILLLALRSFGQTVKLGDSVEISFLTPDIELVDSSQLFIRIAFKNIIRKPISVYKDLNLGYPQERFANLDLVLERRISGKYIRQWTGSYRISEEYSTNRAFRHFDPKKKFWLHFLKILCCSI